MLPIVQVPCRAFVRLSPTAQTSGPTRRPPRARLASSSQGRRFRPYSAPTWRPLAASAVASARLLVDAKSRRRCTLAQAAHEPDRSRTVEPTATVRSMSATQLRRFGPSSAPTQPPAASHRPQVLVCWSTLAQTFDADTREPDTTRIVGSTKALRSIFAAYFGPSSPPTSVHLRHPTAAATPRTPLLASRGRSGGSRVRGPAPPSEPRRCCHSSELGRPDRAATDSPGLQPRVARDRTDEPSRAASEGTGALGPDARAPRPTEASAKPSPPPTWGCDTSCDTPATPQTPPIAKPRKVGGPAEARSPPHARRGPAAAQIGYRA